MVSQGRGSPSFALARPKKIMRQINLGRTGRFAAILTGRPWEVGAQQRGQPSAGRHHARIRLLTRPAGTAFDSYRLASA